MSRPALVAQPGEQLNTPHVESRNLSHHPEQWLSKAMFTAQNQYSISSIEYQGFPFTALDSSQF
jgi:hypothetical protein